MPSSLFHSFTKLFKIQTSSEFGKNKMTSAVITTLQFPHYDLTMMTPEDHTFIFCFTALHDTNPVLYLIFISITFVFHICFCSDNFQGRYLFHPKLYFLIHSTAVFSSILKKKREKFFMSTLSFLINSVSFFLVEEENKSFLCLESMVIIYVPIYKLQVMHKSFICHTFIYLAIHSLLTGIVS